MFSAFAGSLATLQDYAVSLPPCPLTGGLPTPAPVWLNPLHLDSEPFLSLLHRLDKAAYGPLGLDMPRWAMFDCGELPGVVTGFAAPAAQLSPLARHLLAVAPDYTGLVPLSMAILIPHPHPGGWFCYSLCSVNDIAPGAGPGQLRLLTLATALLRLQTQNFWGITQWRSPTMRVFQRLGPLQLVCAYTPAHSEWKTVSFCKALDPQSLHRLLAGQQPPTPTPEFWLDCDDVQALMALQQRLEQGESLLVCGPPKLEGDRTLYPIAPKSPRPEAP